MLNKNKQLVALVMMVIFVFGCLITGCGGAKKDDATNDTSNATKKQDR